MYTLFINQTPIKNFGKITWSDSLKSFANTVSFECDTRFELGQLFEIRENTTTIIGGILTNFIQKQPDIFVYEGFDIGFFLNKYNVIKQFNNARISDAFISLCKEFDIPQGTIPKIETTISKIYRQKRLLDIFNELILYANEKSRIDYFFSCRNGKFNIHQYTYRDDIRVRLANTFEKSYQKTITAIELKKSISQNTIKNTITLTMLGNYELQKGIIIPLEQPVLALKGNYLIISSTHIIDSIKETVKVSLVEYKKEIFL